MNKNLKKRVSRERRRKSIRGKIHGTLERPRLSVFKSNKHIYAQIVDDDTGRTIVSASSLKLNERKRGLERAAEVGLVIASVAKAKKVTTIVFDRGGYPYHGQVRVLAEKAREGGLVF